MKRFLMTGLVTLLMTSPALGGSVEQARSLFHKGNYEAAQITAMALDSQDAQLLAAEIKGARIMLMDVEDAKDTAKAALKIVEDILDEDPDNTEALFLQAMHQGFRTRSSSAFSIIMGGMIGDTKDDIEAFAAAAPGDPRADALLGAWHLGIVRAAGDGRFGASLTEGIAAYDRAVAAMPEDIPTLANYAFSLIVMEEPELIPRAKELLVQLETIKPTDAFTTETKARMMRLLAVIDQPEVMQETARGLLNTEEVEG
ncbi:MAG: hypothetical protein AAGJ85_04105 [Pseudomonadota bacterium]